MDNREHDLLLSVSGSVKAIGDLTISGNSNLKTVNCVSLNCSVGTGTFSDVSSGTMEAYGVSVENELTADSIRCSSSIICPSLRASVSTGRLMLPTTSGTLALTSDLPNKTTLTLSGTTVSYSNILNIVVSYSDSAASSWGKFSPTTSFINTYSAQLNHKLFKCVLSSLYYQDDQLKGTMEASGLIYFSELPVGDGTKGTFYGWGRLISFHSLSDITLQDPTITLTEI